MRFFLAPVFACAIFFGAVRTAWAGPPYLTDDPVPVAYRNYEIYIGYEGEYGNGESQTSVPFAEINYGPLPNVQIAGSFSLTASRDDDFGIKYRFIPEGASRPQVAFYPSIGNSQTLFLPLWAQKTVGRVTLFGGGGWNRNSAAGGQNYWSGGLAGTYEFSDQVNAGMELYSTGSDRIGERGSTSIGIGMNDDYSPIHSVLFSFGTSIAGARTVHGYVAYELRLGPRAVTPP
ncbi:MAG TPA: hypothetical protein VKR56_13700 [Candidatus Cybelea sp.]|nr:hypothetical protein [Candidatus Cybelea sp.]